MRTPLSCQEVDATMLRERDTVEEEGERERREKDDGERESGEGERRQRGASEMKNEKTKEESGKKEGFLKWPQERAIGGSLRIGNRNRFYS